MTLSISLLLYAQCLSPPSAVSEGPWGCCVDKCQQPRHQLRNCAAFQRIPVEDRGSLVRLHHLCRKCLEPDHGLRGSACSSTAVGPKEICPIKKCKGKHHLLLHLKPIERLRMESCPVSPGRQECQEEVSGQQEVAAERLAAVASEQDVLKVISQSFPHNTVKHKTILGRFMHQLSDFIVIRKYPIK